MRGFLWVRKFLSPRNIHARDKFRSIFSYCICRLVAEKIRTCVRDYSYMRVYAAFFPGGKITQIVCVLKCTLIDY